MLLHAQISFCQYFSDFCPKIEPKFDRFVLNFEFHPSLLIPFSNPEIPIVQRRLQKWTLIIIILQSNGLIAICPAVVLLAALDSRAASTTMARHIAIKTVN